MFEWVPSAICFLFGHSYYFPCFEKPPRLRCRRCRVEYPHRVTKTRMGRYVWFGGDV